MPSKREREKPSRQSDATSDSENMDVMLGSYYRSGYERYQNERHIEVDIESKELQQNANHKTQITSEDSRSLLTTNSRKNNKITVETARKIICGITK